MVRSHVALGGAEMTTNPTWVSPEELEQAGVAAVYTPKDFELNRIMFDLVRIVESRAGEG